MSLLISLLVVTVYIDAYSCMDAQSQTWNININELSTESFYYFFNKAVGSGHGALLLRSDWRQYMKEGQNLINFTMVRAHGILDDDVGVVNKNGGFSFINIDKIYEFLLSINMMPYIEISFMPNKFASEDTTIAHYEGNTSPPISWDSWYNLIYEWVSHLVDYFGINQVSKWHFEIWNEPNAGNFWYQNNYTNYLILYNTTVTAIKNVNNKLSVGGPTINNISIAYLTQFLDDLKANNIPIDFVVAHSYPNNPWIGPNITAIDTYYNVLKKAVDLCKSYKLPFLISEFNSGCCTNPFHDGFSNNDNYYSAVFLMFWAKYLQPLFVGGDDRTFKFMSYWAISDVFEEGGFNSNEFNNLYGLQSIRGIKKPAFRSLELLNTFGSEVEYDSLLVDGNGLNITNSTVQVYCLQNKNMDKRYGIFVVNWNNYGFPIYEQSVNIYVNNLKDTDNLKTVVLYRIDANHTTPLQAWKAMGSPKYPTMNELNRLEQASIVEPLNVSYTVINSTTITLSLYLPIYSLAVLDLQY